MKITLSAILSLALCGCQCITLPNGAKIHSFGNKVNFGALSYSTNGMLTVTNYNLDQVSGIQAVGQAVIQGIAAGASKAIIP